MGQTYDVALIKALGQDMIIVHVPPTFGGMDLARRRQAATMLQVGAIGAGLSGAVVAVWDAGDGHLGLHAPMQWHEFFKDVTLTGIARRFNCTLTIG